jgi:folate-binding protein YgfZ
VSGLDAARHACALADRTDLGRLLASGPDFLPLLHRLSTGDVKDLAVGQGRPTVLTSVKGRIVARLFVHRMSEAAVLVVVGPGEAARVMEHLAAYTFAERTGLSDVTGATFSHALLGPAWTEAAARAGLPALAPYGGAGASVASVELSTVRTNGFDDAGLLVVGPREAAGRVHAALLAAVKAVGGEAIDAADLEAWRILTGFPGPGRELTDEHNPLEAGLREAVSFTKGCYVGQEVVARLNTYDKVARAIVRLELEAGAAVPSPGATVLHDDRPVGSVTSAVLPRGARSPIALAYVKSRELPASARDVVVDDAGRLARAAILRP